MYRRGLKEQLSLRVGAGVMGDGTKGESGV